MMKNENPRTIPNRCTLRAVRIACLLAVAVGCAEEPEEPLKPIPTGMMGAMNTPFITPTVENPEHFQPQNVTVPDSARVIGLTSEGVDRCYLLEALTPIAGHVVMDNIGDRKYAVTYCDTNDNVRVLTGSAPDWDVRVGGFMDGELSLLCNGRMYAQSSKEIPLQDLEFTQMTWGEWKSAHPATTIYLGKLAGTLGRSSEPVSQASEPTP